MNDVGDWLISTAKRSPEALLVLAAGCALMMRGSGTSSETQAHGFTRASASNAPWVGRATEKGAEVASDVKARIVDAASSVTEQVSDVAKTLSTQSSQVVGQARSMFSSGFERMVHEQPLALVALGLAAGATVAALLPKTAVEERALGSARDAISGMAGELRENVIAAATDAGQRLTEGVAERATEGMKELAQDVAGQFSEKVGGGVNKPREEPGSVGSLPNRGT
jgi:hypothetical protein